MLVEKFDFIEFLRLAIASGAANGKKISKDIVLGELALMPKNTQMWACLLLEKVEFERVALITEAKKIYETQIINGEEVKRRIDDIPGKVKMTQGEISSAVFFKVRNIIASKIHKEMIRNKFKPSNAQGDLSNIAKGVADAVLRGHVLVKAMCGACQGLGKLELFNHDTPFISSKFCNKCDGSGRLPYTINEKMKIAKLSITKTAYLKSYSKYELVGEAIIAQWMNEIRDRLLRAFRFEPSEVVVIA